MVVGPDFGADSLRYSCGNRIKKCDRLVAIARDPEDGLFLLTAELEVSLPTLDAAEASALIEETEKICPYAKMARQGIQSSIKCVVSSDPAAST